MHHTLIILLYFTLHCIGYKSILCYMSQSIMNLKVDLYMCGHVCDFVRVLIKYMQLHIQLCVRPGPIMVLVKWPIMLLSNALKFSLFCPNYAPLCLTRIHYALLPESEDKSISLTTSISKQLRVLNFTKAPKVAQHLISDNYF